MTAGGCATATETEQQQGCAELARFEEDHYAECLAYEAWAAASRLHTALQDSYLAAEERAEIRDLLLEALELVQDNTPLARRAA